MIRVDGRDYKVSVVEVGLDVEFMYKYAERTEDFKLNYELGAVFLNQSIKFGVEGSNNEDYVSLMRLLSTRSNVDKGTGHNVEIWTPYGKMTFLMYPNKITTKLLKERNGNTWWTGTEVKFIAVKPVESF